MSSFWGFIIVLCEMLVVDWNEVCLLQGSCHLATNQMRVDCAVFRDCVERDVVTISPRWDIML